MTLTRVESAPPLRVLIADDHVPLRAGVREVLERAGLVVCAEAGSAEAAIRAAVDHCPDVCLIDLRMPGGGIRAIREISAQVLGTSVVVLTVSPDEGDCISALRAGAVGYFLKDMDTSRLPQALRDVAAGQASVPRHFTATLIDEIWRGGRGRRVRTAAGRAVELTNREWQVLDLLAQGQTTAAMAAQLGVSEVTVRRHVSGMMDKLGVGTRAAAVELLDARRPDGDRSTD